jgi:hypothetical protein
MALTDKELIEEIEELGEGLTSWEAKFIDSIMKQLDVVGQLTRKQSATLWKIYKERVPDA